MRSSATIACVTRCRPMCSGSKRCVTRRRTTGSTSSTSGTKMPALDRRQVCVGALALLTGARAAAAFGFDELMAMLSQRKAGEARFSEERDVSGLDQPLRYTGTMSFNAPDRLERQTLTPRRESFVVDGNQLTLQRGERVRHLTLDSVPELAALVAALRGTLSGDGSALRRHFKPTVDGNAARWTLTLVPLDFGL